MFTVLICYKYGTVAADLFVFYASEMSTEIMSAVLDAGDIATDIVACDNVVRDPSLVKFHPIYLALTVIASVIGLCCLGIKFAGITHLCREMRGSGRKESKRNMSAHLDTDFRHRKKLQASQIQYVSKRRISLSEWGGGGAREQERDLLYLFVSEILIQGFQQAHDEVVCGGPRRPVRRRRAYGCGQHPYCAK